MTIKEIDEALQEGQSLKQIAEAYSEIANLKIKRIRNQVLRNRLFFKEISTVYTLIKILATQKKIVPVKTKDKVSLLLTSNYRFYGSINSEIINFFLKTTKKFETDKIILGKAAVDFFGAHKLNYPEVLLKDDQPTALELTKLTSMVKDYSQVFVFYSSLKSPLVQQPMVADITASASPHLPGVPDFKFIFEPELPKILAFFDSQILTLLLEGTFLESELARTASRFISMDQAETQANKFISEYQKLKKIAKRNLENKTILENFASMSAIRREYG